jgi:hemoglobin
MVQPKPITAREDIEVLVQEFYGKVRRDPLIGPIFEQQAQVNWNEHLPKLVNFWSDLLLGEDSYRGRPFPPHIRFNLEILHFERWLQLFVQTVDENFVGLKADEAKRRAMGIAQNFLANIEHLKANGRF